MPCLLLRNRGLVKPVRFKDPAYVGDPINTVRIFNEKEVDELVFLDITATLREQPPQMKLLAEIASECFMPFAYGGGIRSLEDIGAILNLGAEKVVLNSVAWEKPDLVTQAATRFGSQSVVASIDVKKKLFGRFSVATRSGTLDTGVDPVSYAKRLERLGAGEILLTSIDRDGTMEGYDLGLVRTVADAVGIPVIASGGAGSVADFGRAVKEGGASAVAAGCLFVYQGPHRAVLINFPTQAALRDVLS